MGHKRLFEDSGITPCNPDTEGGIGYRNSKLDSARQLRNTNMLATTLASFDPQNNNCSVDVFPGQCPPGTQSLQDSHGSKKSKFEKNLSKDKHLQDSDFARSDEATTTARREESLLLGKASGVATTSGRMVYSSSSVDSRLFPDRLQAARGSPSCNDDSSKDSPSGDNHSFGRRSKKNSSLDETLNSVIPSGHQTSQPSSFNGDENNGNGHEGGSCCVSNENQEDFVGRSGGELSSNDRNTDGIQASILISSRSAGSSDGDGSGRKPLYIALDTTTESISQLPHFAIESTSVGASRYSSATFPTPSSSSSTFSTNCATPKEPLGNTVARFPKKSDYPVAKSSLSSQNLAASPNMGPSPSSQSGPQLPDLTRTLYYRLGRRVLRSVRDNELRAPQRAKFEGIIAKVQEAVTGTFVGYCGNKGRNNKASSGPLVEPFGSFMCDLGSSSSDIDLVITGLREPSRTEGFYNRYDRDSVAAQLGRLEGRLRHALPLCQGVEGVLLIGHARIPVLKLTLLDGTKVDITISNREGPQAAEFVLSQVRLFWPLRPLVMVLKTLLRKFSLNEVKDGGLSSYGLTYMVLAHLLEEEREAQKLPRGTRESFRNTPSRVVSPLHSRTVARTYETGRLLHSFLDRFGNRFSLCNNAVSTLDGGVVSKSRVQKYISVMQYDKITTIDPNTRREITHGSYKAVSILNAFRDAHRYISALVEAQDGTGAAQEDSSSIATSSSLSSSLSSSSRSTQHPGLGFRPMKAPGLTSPWWDVQCRDVFGPHESDAESESDAAEEDEETDRSDSVSGEEDDKSSVGSVYGAKFSTGRRGAKANGERRAR